MTEQPTEQPYPKEFLRGIANKDFIIDNGCILCTAFQFDDVARSDGYREASINWLDDDGAITLALNQRKENGKIQFPGGVARIDLNYTKMILHNFSQADFSYERAPLENNKYHGNLLLANSLSKQIRLMIMNGLALAAGNTIIPQNNES